MSRALSTAVLDSVFSPVAPVYDVSTAEVGEDLEKHLKDLPGETARGSLGKAAADEPSLEPDEPTPWGQTLRETAFEEAVFRETIFGHGVLLDALRGVPIKSRSRWDSKNSRLGSRVQKFSSETPKSRRAIDKGKVGMLDEPSEPGGQQPSGQRDLSEQGTSARSFKEAANEHPHIARPEEVSIPQENAASASNSRDAFTQQEDVEWVARARAGDAGAFDDLVLKHTGRLYALVFQMTGNHDDTNDLLQEVWTKVYRSLAGFRGAAKFSTWTHSIAVNMTINFLKRRSRRQTVNLDAFSRSEESVLGETTLGADLETSLEASLVSTQTPRTAASLSELQARLTEALERLSPEHRAAVVMFDVQGLAHAEIAKIVGVSEGTVRSRLFYAHRLLQGYLADFQPASGSNLPTTSSSNPTASSVFPVSPRAKPNQNS